MHKAAQTIDSALLNAALSYAENGWRVIPIAARSKKPPLVKNWPMVATCDSAIINHWWSRWPDANIGIACGAESGLFVADVDNIDAWRDLVAANGGLPRTAKQISARGEHYFFKGDARIKNQVSQIAQGVDVRSEGGYIVVAPSIHPSGSQYEWDVGPEMLATAPEWLLQKITHRDCEKSVRRRIHEGSRNETLFQIGLRKSKSGMNQIELESYLLEENAALCVPPLLEDEVLTICKQASRYSTTKLQPLFAYRKFINEETEKLPRLRHILHQVTFFMKPDGVAAWPTIEQIMDGTGYSKPTVIKWLSYAVKKGYILRRRRLGDGQKHWNYVYSIPIRFRQVKPH